jgi:hypothetical protein
MPSSPAHLFAAAGLNPESIVSWGEPLTVEASGAYVVATVSDPGSPSGSGSPCPISPAALTDWLRARPELKLDGRRPTIDALAERLSSFWLPDEPVLYIGLTTRSVRKRLAEYYKTPSEPAGRTLVGSFSRRSRL